jgi:hypothetical protein
MIRARMKRGESRIIITIIIIIIMLLLLLLLMAGLLSIFSGSCFFFFGCGAYRRVSLFWHLNDLVLYTLFVPE